MGFFKKLGEFVANPIRGLGRIVRGNVKQGLGDITGTARHVAPFIPGVGTVASLAIGAADDLLKDRGVEQTLFNAGAGLVANKAANVLANRFSGGSLPAEQTATPTMLSNTDFVPVGAGVVPGVTGNAPGYTPVSMNLPRAGTPPATSPVGAGVASNAPRGMSLDLPSVGPLPAISPRAPGVARYVTPATSVAQQVARNAGIGGFSSADKWQLGLSAASGLTDAYGAYKAGQVEDQRMRWEEEDREWDRAREQRRDAAMRAAAKRMADNWRTY